MQPPDAKLPRPVRAVVFDMDGLIFNDEASTRSLIEQVAILHQVGIKTVLVHGGGPQLDNLQATFGIDTRMINGRRVTDQRSIDVTAMALNGRSRRNCAMHMRHATVVARPVRRSAPRRLTSSPLYARYNE